MHLTLAGSANSPALISLIGLRDLIIRICRHSDLVCTAATDLGSCAGQADSFMFTDDSMDAAPSTTV